MASEDGAGKRAALYMRVSTDQQTIANQEAQLRKWAKHHGFKIVKVYADNGISGIRRHRKGLTDMLEGAHRRDFDVLMVWALDRFSREGIRAMLGYLEQLQEAGVRVLSHQEEWLKIGDPMGELQVATFAWVAKQERIRLSERTKAGMARAKAEGKKFGRPPLPQETLEKIKAALTRGTGIREAARLCGVSHGSVQRVCDKTRGLRKVWDQQRKPKRRKAELQREAVAS
jgi:DNA invertase Pin-like site-specific DNA recombinase